MTREAHRSKLDDCLRRRLGAAEASALAERLSEIDRADSADMAAIAATLGSA